MITQDAHKIYDDTLRDDDSVLEDIVPTTLIAPAMFHPPQAIDDHDGDEKTQEDLMDSDYNHHYTHSDGHEDVDNEQPYGWVVIGAAFFVQAMVIGTVNGYGVYEVIYRNRRLRSAF